MKYTPAIHRKGFYLRVTPEDRAADVLHYLITDYLLGSQPLEGVTWEHVANTEYEQLAKRRADELRHDMMECVD